MNMEIEKRVCGKRRSNLRSNSWSRRLSDENKQLQIEPQQYNFTDFKASTSFYLKIH